MPLFDSFATVVAGLSFRALPALVYALFASSSAIVRLRGVAIGGALLIAAAALLGFFSLRALLEMCQVWLLLLSASCAAYFVYAASTAPVRGGRLFLGLSLVFLLLPSVVWRSGLLVTYLIISFELLFSSHSFFAERSSNEASWPELRDYLFFLIVDPTLVYTERSQRRVTVPISTDGAAFCRIAVGALALWGSRLITQVASYGLIGAMPTYGLSESPRYFEYVAEVLPALCSLYWAHSGLAGFQIGLMSLIGYQTPERYRYPFLAKSPIEFWQRWNIYLGEWLRRYVFAPLALALLRRAGTTARGLVQSGAAMVTLTFCGLLHDLSGYCATLATDYKVAKCFFLAGAMMTVWTLASRIGRAFVVGGAWSTRALQTAITCVSLLLWFHGVLLLGSILHSGRVPNSSAAADLHGLPNAKKHPS